MLPGVVDDAGVTVEHELVLPSHQPAEGDAGEVVAGALGEHALSLGPLAGVVGGGGDVDDQRGAGEGLLGGGRAGLPDVLAHRQPEAVLAEGEHGPRRSGPEVAVLVEHPVVGEMDLAVDRVNGSVGEHGRGVVDMLGPLGEPDDRDDAVRLGGQLAQRRARIGEEVLAQQQILGRIAGERELGEQHQISFGVACRVACRRACARRCRAMSPDRGVHLTERQAHVMPFARPAWTPVASGRSSG